MSVESVLIRAIGLASPAPGPLPEAASIIAAEAAVIERHPQFIGADGRPQTCGAVKSCLRETDPVARLDHMLKKALAEMAPQGVRNTGGTHLFLALPDWLKTAGPLQQRMQQALQHEAYTRFGPVTMVFNDRVGGLTALAVAQEALVEKRVDIAIVAAADTFVAPMVLDMLALADRAPVSDAAYVPVPGEAAVSVVMTRDKGQPDALIRVIGTAKRVEPQRLGDHERGLMGRAVVEMVNELMGQDAPALLVLDMNGERHRAEELGFVATTARQLDIAERLPILPALSVGDTGVASGLLAVALTPFLGISQDPGDALIWVGNHNGKRIAARVAPLVELAVADAASLLDGEDWPIGDAPADDDPPADPPPRRPPPPDEDRTVIAPLPGGGDR